MANLFLKNFRIVDADHDFMGSLFIEHGIITKIIHHDTDIDNADITIDGRAFGHSAVIMPAFVDLHAHFRDPGFPEKETLESASLAAVAGGFTTVVCMANTNPVIDTVEKAHALKTRSDALGLIDLYPVVSLTKNMEGRELSGIKEWPGDRERAARIAAFENAPEMEKGSLLAGIRHSTPGHPISASQLGKENVPNVIQQTNPGHSKGASLSDIKDTTLLRLLQADSLKPVCVRMLSEDGKDVNDDALFLAAMGEAKRLGLPVSCHCDFGGQQAESAKAAGRPRAEWSRIEENNAVRRAIEWGKKAGCHIHIAHVSTREAADYIRRAKKEPPANGFILTCEATPHHIGATEEDARRMGDSGFGRVNPPLRTEADRLAIIAAIHDGTIDAIATDHAPHTDADKEKGSPGFSGLETAFAVCLSHLAPDADPNLAPNLVHTDPNFVPNLVWQRLSALMSKNPARILGLRDRGTIVEGLRADLVIVDTGERWKVDPAAFRSRGKCSPFTGRELRGTILMTLNGGKIVQYRQAL